MAIMRLQLKKKEEIFSLTPKFGDRIKGLKLARFLAYLRGAAVDEVPQ